MASRFGALRFFEVTGLAQALTRASGGEVELVLLFNRGEPDFESVVNASNFALFCTPTSTCSPSERIASTSTKVYEIPCRARPDAAHGLRGLRHH